MLDDNALKLTFAGLAATTVFFGSLVKSLEKYLPSYVTQTFRYGKFAYNGPKGKLQPIEVPKAWFRHFYVFSSIYTTIFVFVAYRVYFLGGEVPLVVRKLLQWTTGPKTVSRISSTSAFLALVLLDIQCLRRFYDTQFVSVFGKNVKMNFGHYLLGFIHYFGTSLAILCEAPIFASQNVLDSKIAISDISVCQVIASVIFLWAWCNQYKATVILANLRKNPAGKVVTNEHRLPHGGWFELVSSPHNLSEIIMYLTLTVILWGNKTWLYIMFWVLINQVTTAFFVHRWYLEKFKDVPKKRKALIPYVF